MAGIGKRVASCHRSIPVAEGLTPSVNKLMCIYFRLLWVGMLGVRLVQTHEPQDTDLAVKQVQICGTYIEVPLPWVASLGVSQMTLAQSRTFWLNHFYHSVHGMWLCWQGRIILSLTLTSFLILLHNPTAPCEIVWHFLLWHRATPVLDIQVRSVGQWYCRPNWAKKGRERRRVCIGRAERSSHWKASPYFILLFASFMVKNMLPGASPWFKPQLCLFPASHLTSLCLIYLFIFSFLKWGWQTHLSHGVVRTKWGDELKTTQFGTWQIVNPIDVRYYWY